MTMTHNALSTVRRRPWPLSLPLRWRLALFYGGLATLVLLLLGLVIYRQIERFTIDNAASRLRSQAETAIGQYAPNVVEVAKSVAGDQGQTFQQPVPISGPVEPGQVSAPAEPAPPPATQAQVDRIDSTGIATFGVASAGKKVVDVVNDLGTRDTAAAWLDRDGRFVIADSRSLAPMAPASRPADGPSEADRVFFVRPELLASRLSPPDPKHLSRTMAMSSESTYITDSPDGSGRTLVMLLPLYQPLVNEPVGVLQLSTSLEAADALLARLRLLLLAGLGGALGITLLVGVPLTRAALRPLDKLVATTERIAADELTARSQLPHGNDEIGRLAAAFDHMLARLQSGFQAQRQFVADAAHELRTPLTAISGLIELLLLGADNEDRATRRRTLATVDRDLARLTRLVNDLLALSRHDLAIPHERQRVDLGELVADIQALTAELAPDRTVTLERPLDRVEVLGDPDHLRQILLNLAENARRYTPAGERIIFRVRRDGHTAEVAVIDTGPGIPPEDLPRIFDRFYRGDRARARVSGGAGLGLAIARAIAQAHAGSLTAESTPGRGAGFILRLPLAATARNGVAASGPHAPSRNL